MASCPRLESRPYLSIFILNHNGITCPVWLSFLDHLQNEDRNTKVLQNGNYLHTDMHHNQQELNHHDKTCRQPTFRTVIPNRGKRFLGVPQDVEIKNKYISHH
jgi:hypothetical protein